MARVAWACVNLLATYVVASTKRKAMSPPVTCRPWKPVVRSNAVA